MPRPQPQPAAGTVLARLGAEFSENINTNRQAQESTREELSVAENACRCFEDGRRDIRSYIDGEVDFFKRNVLVSDLTHPKGDTSRFHVLRNSGSTASESRMLRALIVSLDPDAVEELMLSVLNERLGELSNAHSDEVRTERLAELQATLDQLEREEEKLIRAAEREGLRPVRRADAPPELVLAQSID